MFFFYRQGDNFGVRPKSSIICLRPIISYVVKLFTASLKISRNADSLQLLDSHIYGLSLIALVKRQYLSSMYMLYLYTFLVFHNKYLIFSAFEDCLQRVKMQYLQISFIIEIVVFFGYGSSGKYLY